LNAGLLKEVLNKLGVAVNITFSSSLSLTAKKDDLLIGIIKSFKEEEYLSGNGALNYMDLKKFQQAGIKIYTFEFQYAEYRQLWNKRIGFLPDLSIIDLFFNNLDNANAYILHNGRIKRVI
jgi:hypothetical protein